MLQFLKFNKEARQAYMYTFFAFLSRMKYIKRWSLMHNTREENVAEHTCQTAMIAHALANIGNAYFNKNHDADKIAAAALFHESSEVLTGDLPTPIKYFNSSISAAYKDLERLANERLAQTLPAELSPKYAAVMNIGDESVKKIVKCADKISAYLKCLEEIKSGNGEFVSARDALRAEITKFNSPEADYFISNFAPAFELTLDQLGADK